MSKDWMSGPDWRKSEEFVFGEMGYLLHWTVSNSWADVVAHRITGRTRPEGVALYGYDFKETPPPDDDADIDGYIKWDGCSELDQGRPHWCGPRDYKMHMALLTYLYRRAFELMGRDQFDVWDEAPTPAAPAPFDPAPPPA